MANGPPPSFRSNLDVQARPNQPEVISLLDDEEQDQRASALSSRPSFPPRRRRVSISEDDDEVIILDGPPPPKRKGRFISSFVDVDPPRARRPPHLARQLRSSPRLPSRSNPVPGHVDAVVLRPGDTPNLALSVDDIPSAQARSSARLRGAAEPRVVIDLMDIESDDDVAPPRRDKVVPSSSSSGSEAYSYSASTTLQRRRRSLSPPSSPSPLNDNATLIPTCHLTARPAHALKSLQTNLILTHFPSFPFSLIPEVLALSWSFHPSSHPTGASLPLDALTPVAQRSITRSVLRSFARHEMTRYEAELVDKEREVTRRFGGIGRERGNGGGAMMTRSDANEAAAEVWKRGRYASVRREANRVADRLLFEFEGRLGGGRGRNEHEEHEEEDDAWDRDEWRD